MLCVDPPGVSAFKIENESSVSLPGGSKSFKDKNQKLWNISRTQELTQGKAEMLWKHLG